MPIFSVYIINRAGGLIYQMDHHQPKTEVEKTFSFPLELQLKIVDERVVVAFGQRDGIKGERDVNDMLKIHLSVYVYIIPSQQMTWMVIVNNKIWSFGTFLAVLDKEGTAKHCKI